MARRATIDPVLIEAYRQFGGHHWASAALRNTLAHAGVTAPHTRRPLSEAMCFGLAGGIGAGYSFGAALPAGLAGSGVSVVGRHRAHDYGAAFVADTLRRLGARVRMLETGGRRIALGNLERTLSEGRPAIVWCAPPKMLGREWAGTFGSHVLVVYGIDPGRRVARVGDTSMRALTLGLGELADLRARVGPHRNRVLGFDPPARLGAVTLRQACRSSIRACARELLRPKRKAWSLPGLLEWSRDIANPASRRGWPRLFPGSRIYGALRDLYDSIETAGTGGSLYRPMYAEFLAETAALTGRRSFKGLAKTYRSLGDAWSELADTALPARVPAFRKTRQLLRERERSIRRGGPGLAARSARTRRQLRDLEQSARHRFPLDREDVMELLIELGESIADLHAREAQAARKLLSAAS